MASITGICKSISVTSYGVGVGPPNNLSTASRPLLTTWTLAPNAFQEFDGDLLVDVVVLDEEDAQAGEADSIGRRGGNRGNLVAGIRKNVHERIHEHRAGHRLNQEAIEMEVFGFFANFVAAERRDHDDRRRILERLVSLEGAGRLQSVHAGHAPVHEDHVVWRVGVRLLDGRDRLGGGGDSVPLRHDPLKQIVDDLARCGIVIHD